MTPIKKHDDIELLLVKFMPLLARIAASYEFDSRLQEDLLQDISLAVWKALDSFKYDASIKTYIAKIAHNRGVDHALKQKRHTQKLADFDDNTLTTSSSDNFQGQSQDEKLDLMSALERLSLNNRQVITMQLEGFNYAEIASILGTSEQAVTKQLPSVSAALVKR
jgi:RNA polymerase sigma factor (sigma-70 family)